MEGVVLHRTGTGSPRAVRVEAGRLRLEIDPSALRLRVADPGHGLALPDLAPRIDARDASGRSVGVPSSRVLSVGELKARAGPAVRIEVQTTGAGALGVRWTIEVPASGAGVACALSLENRSPRPLRISALAPFATAGASFGSASAPAVPPPGAPAGPLDGLPLRLLPGDPPGLVAVGFTTARRVDGRIDADAGLGPRLPFRLESAPDAPTLGPGATLASERAWLATGDDAAALQLEWARRAAAEMDARVPLGATRLVRIAPEAPVTRARIAAACARARGQGDVLVAWETARPTLAGVGCVDALALPPSADGVEAALDLAFTGERLWALAPGPPVVPSDAPPGAPDRTRFAAFALLGIAPPEPGELDPERARWRRLAEPPLRRGSCARRIASARALVTPLAGGRTAVLLVNGATEAAPLGLRLGELGLSGPHHVFDFWEAADLGTTGDAVEAARIPAGGCRLLAFTPVAERAVVVGTTLHLGMGSVEVAGLRALPDGALSLSLRLPGHRHGAVWVAVPGEGRARRIEVAFEDSLALELAPPSPARPPG